MYRFVLVGLLIAALFGSNTLTSQSSGFIAVPASAFTPRQVKGNVGGYEGNETGTARSFGSNSFSMFAPVSLPNGTRVTSLSCGGSDTSNQIRLQFTLRRNAPQQANVDMATVSTTFPKTGFEFLSTTSIVQPVIDNQRFNYYLIAETRHINVGFCATCSVAFCRIGFTAS